jgi:hypothetical protein
MSTPPVPTKPDASSDDSPAERRVNEAPARRNDAPAQNAVTGRRAAGPSEDGGDERPESASVGYGPTPSDRAVDADLLIDIPQLTVEELALELEASLMLNRVKLDAKGLDLGLFLKADFDGLRALVARDSEAERAKASQSPRGSDVMGVRSGLRELLGATRDAYRELSDRDVQRQLRDVHESAREAHDRVTTAEEPALGSSGEDEEGRESERDRDGDAGRSHAVRERLRHAAGQGAKAAGLTAAGLAGGALLESRTKASHRLPIPRRRNRAQVVWEEISRRLP